MQNIASLPPPIVNQFTKDLLSLSTQNLFNDAETLLGLIKAMDFLYSKKLKNLPEKMDSYRCNLEILMGLYERAKKKEKELEEKTGHPFTRPFFYFYLTNKDSGKIYSRFRWRRKVSDYMRKYYNI